MPKAGIPQSEIIPEETIAVGKKPVEKVVEVNEPTAIEKKPVEPITVLDDKNKAMVEKPAAVEKESVEKESVEKVSIPAPKPKVRLELIEKPAAIESVPLAGNRPGETLIVVEANGANQIIAADGREVEIKGSNCVIVISGGCKALKLSGERNQVQCDSANYVNISGDHNTVVSGVLGKAVITGNRNIVSWGEGMDGSPPIADSTGQENEIERLE